MRHTVSTVKNVKAMGPIGQQHSVRPAVVENTIADLSGSKWALARRVQQVIAPEFIESRICPRLEPQVRRGAIDCETKVVRNTGTGRLTIRYVFDQDVVVFAKLYGDRMGMHCYEVNQALWKSGFNNSGRLRVPQPLGFFADHALLLMRGVQGTPLRGAFGGDISVDLVLGSREAGDWLAVLHRSTLEVGSPELSQESLRQCWMSDRVNRAIARRPEKSALIGDLIDLLKQRVAKLGGNCCRVFTHGRYHLDHVFLSPEATSVIDLDRCRPSDPAKDAAEFVRMLRLAAFRESCGMERAEVATSAFLSSYLAQVPRGADNLGCYWAASTLDRLLRALGQQGNKSEESQEQLEDFYVAEITRALSFGR